MSTIMGQTSYATSPAVPVSTPAILSTAGGVGYYGAAPGLPALLPAPLVKDINYANMQEQQHHLNHLDHQQGVHSEQQRDREQDEQHRHRRFVPPPTLINTC